MTDERVQRYAKAIALNCGYVDPLRQHQMAARAAVEVANAEQQAVASENERLCIEVERLQASPKAGKHGDDCERCYWKGRALAAEAKVARVDAITDGWEGVAGDLRRRRSCRHDYSDAIETLTRHIEDVRAALDGSA